MHVILKYFPDLTQKQIEQFSRLLELFSDWNQKINLISRKDIDHLYIRHILHSLAIAKIISFNPTTKVLDVGTGGGFPGIPLAILFPEVKFHLVDSIGKKIKVVQDITEKLSLENTTSQQIRAEDLNQQYDFIVSRAVTNFSKFRDLVQGKISVKSKNEIKNGVLYLKGGDFEDEIKSFKNRVTIYNISEMFEEEFFETKKIIYLPYN